MRLNYWRAAGAEPQIMTLLAAFFTPGSRSALLRRPQMLARDAFAAANFDIIVLHTNATLSPLSLFAFAEHGRKLPALIFAAAQILTYRLGWLRLNGRYPNLNVAPR